MLDHGLRHIITQLYRCSICEFIQFISIPVYMFFVARPGNMTFNTILLPDRKSQDKLSCQTNFLIQFVCINRSFIHQEIHIQSWKNFLFEETYDLTASICNEIFFYNLTRFFIISPCQSCLVNQYYRQIGRLPTKEKLNNKTLRPYRMCTVIHVLLNTATPHNNIVLGNTCIANSAFSRRLSINLIQNCLGIFCYMQLCQRNLRIYRYLSEVI